MRIQRSPRRDVTGLAVLLWIAIALPLAAQAQAPTAAAELAPGGSFALPPVSAFARTGADPLSRSAVLRAWHAPAASLEARVAQTRRAALEVGAWNLDPAARALIRKGAEGAPLERARGAVDLAPDLPAAHLALARVLWLQEDSPFDALRSVFAGLRAVGHHTEASLWFGGSALYMASAALVGTGLLVILLVGIASLPHAAHDLGHVMRVPVPLFAGFAGLAALLLLPLLLGEGPVGLAVALLCIAMFYGRTARRVALVLAALAMFCGLHPVPRLAGLALSAFPADPVARAAYTTSQGLASPVDLARLQNASSSDPLALRGLAIHARQVGNLGGADALYQRLLEKDPTDLALINNAANVRLDLGHVRSALDLYDRAIELANSPVVLFNLSQAYGRSFQVDELNRALAEAQRANGELVADFTRLQRTKNENFVVDFPIPTRLMWQRALSRDGEALAAEFRAELAPGRLGGSGERAGAFLAVLVGTVWLLALRFRPSGWCARCGTRQCARCGQSGGTAGLCGSCTRLFYHPETTDRALRAERVEALRARERRMRRLATLGSVVIPGAAGFLDDRPIAGLFATFCFTLAVSAVVWRSGAVPDPLVAGAAAPVAFLGAAGIAAFLYVGVVAACLARPKEA